MADRNSRRNAPISEEQLFAAGLPRDLPQKEPVPPPPAVLPNDLNPTLPGIEYRAMPGILVTPPEQQAESPTPNGDARSAFGWLVRRRK
jgi:hypothetical protein